MALHDDIVRDSQGGLFSFGGWILTEGSDFRLESDRYIRSDEVPMDFTVLTAVVARLYEVKAHAEATVVALTWAPNSDGWFALTCSDTLSTGTAGSTGTNAQRRRVRCTAYGDLPDGRRIQLVDPQADLWIQQRGTSS